MRFDPIAAFKRWRQGPPVPEKQEPGIICPKCRKRALAWRTYADGGRECVPCAHGLTIKSKKIKALK